METRFVLLWPLLLLLLEAAVIAAASRSLWRVGKNRPLALHYRHICNNYYCWLGLSDKQRQNMPRRFKIIQHVWTQRCTLGGGRKRRMSFCIKVVNVLFFHQIYSSYLNEWLSMSDQAHSFYFLQLRYFFFRAFRFRLFRSEKMILYKYTIRIHSKLPERWRCKGNGGGSTHTHTDRGSENGSVNYAHLSFNISFPEENILVGVKLRNEEFFKSTLSFISPLPFPSHIDWNTILLYALEKIVLTFGALPPNSFKFLYNSICVASRE